MPTLQSREQELRNVYRYGFFESPIYYKANLWIHSARISWITRDIANFLEKLKPGIFDTELAVALSIAHDDTEIIVGDIVAPVKQAFTPEEKESYEQDCRNAIDTLADNYNHLFLNHDYKKLLIMEADGNSIEYDIMKFADKLESHLEVSHELLAGNKAFDDECMENFKISSYDFSYNSSKEYLNKLLSRLGITEKDVDNNKFLNITQNLSSEELLSQSKGFHTKESAEEFSLYHVYNAWIGAHFQYGNAEQRGYLYERVE